MDHPPLEVLLQSPIVTGIVADHVQACSACRRLVALTRLEDPRERGDLEELPVESNSTLVRAEVIGTGGMGHTFRARDRVLWRDVAMKIPLGRHEVKDSLLHESLRRRFEREARITAQLQHPGIVPVYQAGRLPNGDPFYTMRLIEGEPMSVKFAHARDLSERLALLPALTAAADAVAYAHHRGIVHRDLKPDNIISGPFGETVVIDWGLATALGEASPLFRLDERETELSLTVQGIGTPPYVAPEQARGHRADVRADVYSLGAILYELLAGEPPYGRRDPPQVRQALLAGPPRPVTELAPSTALAAIIAKAMARDPDKRYADAAELAADLRRFQKGLLVSVHRYTPSERLALLVQRHKPAVAVGVLSLATMAAVGIASFLRIVSERDAASAARRRAEQARRDALLHLSAARGTIASQLARDPERRLEAASLGASAVSGALALGEAPPAAALQGLVDTVTMGPPLRPLSRHETAIEAAAATADGTRLLTADRSGRFSIWRLPSGKLEATYPIRLTRPDRIVLSPDERFVFVCGWEDHAEIVPLAGGTARSVERAPLVRLCAFEPETPAFGWTAAADLVRWEVATGRELERHPLGAQASAMAFGPDGVLAVGTSDGTILWRDPATGELRRKDGAHEGSVVALVFTPDGVLHSAGEDGALRAWTRDRAKGLDGRLVRSGLGRLRTLTAFPNGNLLAVARDDDTNGPGHAWIVAPRHSPPDPEFRGWPVLGGDRRLLASTDRVRVSLVDPSNGRALVSLDAPQEPLTALPTGPETVVIWDMHGRLLLWDVRSGPSTGLLLGPTGPISQVARQPHGARAATLGLDGTLWIWDLASGQPSARVAAPPGVAFLEGEISAGDRVAALGDDGILYVYDAITGRPLGRVGDTTYSAWAFTSDGEILTGNSTGQVALWRDTTLVGSWDSGERVTAVAAVDNRIATGHPRGRVQLFDRSRGVVVAERAPDVTSRDAVTKIATTADGRSLVLGFTGGDTVVVNAVTLAETGRVAGTLVAVLDDGRWATATPDGRVHVVVERDARVVLGPGAAVTAVAPGRGTTRDRLAVGRADGTVEIWRLDAVQRELVLAAVPSPPLGPPVGLAASPDGEHLMVAYASGAVRLNPISARAALARACALLRRFERLSRSGEECPDVAP